MPSNKTLNAVWKGVKSFFTFWKDFLVGDSPVLALGVIVILCVAYLLRGSAVLAPISTIILVLVLITFAVWQKTRARCPKPTINTNKEAKTRA
jgi:ABC-type bacteriocin/lantibiotic exporter with double-glycine peptidase domain